MPNATITIPLSEYIQLTKDSEWLRYLEAAGVDNWSGYAYAQELVSKNKVKNGTNPSTR